MSLGANNAQAARCKHHLALGRACALCVGECRGVDRWINFGGIQAFDAEGFGGETDRVSSELNVCSATSHVGGDRDGSRSPRLRNHWRFAFMLLCVQDVVRHTFTLQHCGEVLRAFNRRGANEHRLASRASLLDVRNDRRIFCANGAVDKIGLIHANHWAMRWNRCHIKAVDLAELFRLCHGRTRHSGELLVETEVVLEGDRCHRDRFALDAEPLFRLNRLMESFGPAAAWHLASREFVHDDNLTVFNDVVTVALEECVCAKCRLKVSGHQRVAAVEVLYAERLLNLRDTLFG